MQSQESIYEQTTIKKHLEKRLMCKSIQNKVGIVRFYKYKI